MQSFKLLVRFILISLALLGLSVSTGASAKTFLVEYLVTPNTVPLPFWQPRSPGEALFDFTIEATLGNGLVTDDPTTLVIESDFGLPSSVSNLNLYGWGTTGQFGDVSVGTPSFQSLIGIFDDTPRDGSVDNLFGFMLFDAPIHFLPPGGSFLALYQIQFWDVLPGPPGDEIRVEGGEVGCELCPNPGVFMRGDIVISDITAIPAVPVPAAVWLFGTALIGLIGFGKRRKAA
jgi:hypothetical protein